MIKGSRIRYLAHRPIENLRVLLPEFNLPVGLFKYSTTVALPLAAIRLEARMQWLYATGFKALADL